MKQVVSPPDLPVNTGSGWESVTLVGWQEQPMATHGPWFSKMEIDQDIQKYMAWSTFNSISLQTIQYVTAQIPVSTDGTLMTGESSAPVFARIIP